MDQKTKIIHNNNYNVYFKEEKINKKQTRQI